MEQTHQTLHNIFIQHVTSLPETKRGRIAKLCASVFRETIADQTSAASRNERSPNNTRSLGEHKFTLGWDISCIDAVAGELFYAWESARASQHNSELCWELSVSFLGSVCTGCGKEPGVDVDPIDGVRSVRRQCTACNTKDKQEAV